MYTGMRIITRKACTAHMRKACRAAAAPFPGVHLVLLSEGCGDPFHRRTARVRGSAGDPRRPSKRRPRVGPGAFADGPESPRERVVLTSRASRRLVHEPFPNRRSGTELSFQTAQVAQSGESNLSREASKLLMSLRVCPARVVPVLSCGEPSCQCTARVRISAEPMPRHDFRRF